MISLTSSLLHRSYPKWKRQARLWLVSCPVILLCLALALGAMVAYLWLDQRTQSYAAANPSTLSSLLAALPGIGYSILLIVMNSAFRKLAMILNEFGEEQFCFLFLFLFKVLHLVF